MAYKKNQETYTKIYWVFTTFMLLSAMPLGIVLIFVKLFERRKKRRAPVFRPVADAPLGAQTTRNTALRPLAVELEEASKKMRRRAGMGLVLTAISAGLLYFCFRYDISLWTAFWCLFCSLYCLATGFHTLSSVRRFRKYVAAMAPRTAVPVEELSAETGITPGCIRTDLNALAFMELIPNAILDENRDILFCF